MARPRFDGGTPEQQKRRDNERKRYHLRTRQRAERKRLYQATYNRVNNAGPARWVHSCEHRDAVRATPEQIAERDQLFAQPQSLTAQLMGDPRPGRSALDQRQQTTKKESSA